MPVLAREVIPYPLGEGYHVTVEDNRRGSSPFTLPHARYDTYEVREAFGVLETSTSVSCDEHKRVLDRRRVGFRTLLAR